MSSAHPSPIVSVVMPTYNGEKFLCSAIQSILSQTFRDFELIVIDDASTDSTPRILAGINDSRLITVSNDRNLGIAGATNKGLELARGKYVALQDHDDISLPPRFQAQVEFLDSHPDVALVGTAALQVDDHDSVLERLVQPTDDLQLKWGLLYGCCFHNTSLMIRRSVILDEGGFRQNPLFPFAPDYDLFSRIACRYRLANLAEPLVLWRRHSKNTSFSNAEQQQQSEVAIAFRNVCALMDSASESTSEWRYRDFLGLRAFLLTAAGKFPTLSPDQVTAGLRFLGEIERVFYQKYAFTGRAAARHRKAVSWKSGKHAVALGIRAPWGWRSRLRIMLLGVLRLGFAAWNMLLSAVVPESLFQRRPVIAESK